jgi:hypothetical protein
MATCESQPVSVTRGSKPYCLAVSAAQFVAQSQRCNHRSLSEQNTRLGFLFRFFDF